jgi:hypothetical protein
MGIKIATQTIPPPSHPPVTTLGPGPTSFLKNPWICGKGGRIEKNVADFRKKVANLRQNSKSRVLGSTLFYRRQFRELENSLVSPQNGLVCL